MEQTALRPTHLPSRQTDPQDRVAELETEVIALEQAIEFLLEQDRHFRYILGAVVQRLWGNPPPKGSIGAFFERSLYPNVAAVMPDGYELRQAPDCPWSRPVRRWTAYGPRDGLAALVKRLGLKAWGGGRPSREHLVRALWDAGHSHAEILAMVNE